MTKLKELIMGQQDKIEAYNAEINRKTEEIKKCTAIIKKKKEKPSKPR